VIGASVAMSTSGFTFATYGRWDFGLGGPAYSTFKLDIHHILDERVLLSTPDVSTGLTNRIGQDQSLMAMAAAFVWRLLILPSS
jgi:hypothetical protein